MSNAMTKSVVRVHCTDLYEGDTFFSGLLSVLEDEFAIVRDPENPDFLFYSDTGTEHHKYNCVKIYFTGENVTPDFNWCDYAIGFDYLSYEDRYFRYPLYWLYFQMLPEEYKPKDAGFFLAEAERKTGFCNFIYSNARCADPARVEFFEKLSAYKRVDSGGKCRNNIGRAIEGVDGKLAWQRRYKFSIAFENSIKSGYTTEKLLHALAAHTIPIYRGDPRVCGEFDAKRFINCADYPSMDAVTERVRELDNDPGQYREMLSQPWFVDPAAAALNSVFPGPPHPLVDFVRHIVRQGPVDARRAPVHGWARLCREHAIKQEMRANVFKRLRHAVKKLFSKT